MVTLIFASQRAGMSVILVMLLIGLLLMFFVNEQQSEQIPVNDPTV
jgi:MFS-type transporter involved in bile tolerance (Atg22 family)